MAIVKAGFALLKEDRKAGFRDGVEPGEPSLRKVPEAFNAIDVVAVQSKLIVLMMDAVALGEARFDEAVIEAKAVGMDAGREIDAALDDAVKHCFGAVSDDLGVEAAAAFEDAEDGCLAACATTFLAANAAGAELKIRNKRMGSGEIHFPPFCRPIRTPQ
jgi:hypothetical protein